MTTGPKAGAGSTGAHRSLHEGVTISSCASGTKQGPICSRRFAHEEATAADVEFAENLVAEAAKHMGRSSTSTGIKEMLYRNIEHVRWGSSGGPVLELLQLHDGVPDVFLFHVEDLTDLSGQQAERWRKWDSCFTTDFSYIHGQQRALDAAIQISPVMMHKLAYWIDQFGISGCVGCGRCITWCPVGIDITEEARVIREGETPASAAG